MEHEKKPLAKRKNPWGFGEVHFVGGERGCLPGAIWKIA